MSPSKARFDYGNEYNPSTEEIIKKYAVLGSSDTNLKSTGSNMNPKSADHYNTSPAQDFTVYSEINNTKHDIRPSRNIFGGNSQLQDVYSSDIDMINNKYGSNVNLLGNDEDLIRYTHSLIGRLPSNLIANEEAENYSRLLSTSISRLIDELERSRNDNIKLVAQLKAKEKIEYKLRDEIDELKLEIENQSIQNQKLEEKNISPVDITSTTDHGYVDPNMKRERDLLRSKLIKYRTLYQESINSNRDSNKQVKFARSKSAPATSTTNEFDQSYEVLPSLQQYHYQPPTKAKINPEYDYEKLIPIISQIVSKVQEATKDSKIMNQDRPNKEITHGEELVSTSEEKLEDINGSNSKDKDSKDAVNVSCYIYNGKNKENSRAPETEHKKKKCEVCLSEKEKTESLDTINLIGEYKWTL